MTDFDKFLQNESWENVYMASVDSKSDEFYKTFISYFNESILKSKQLIELNVKKYRFLKNSKIKTKIITSF